MKIIKLLTQYLIRNFFDILGVIIGFLYFFIFLFVLSGSYKNFIINFCFALVSFLLAVVAIYIIIGLCKVLAGSMERYGEKDE